MRLVGPGDHLGGDEEEGFAVGGTSDVAEGHVVGDLGKVLRDMEGKIGRAHV